MSSGDVVPVSLPIIQHIQDRLNKVSEDAGHLSKEMQRDAGQSEASAASRERYDSLFSRVRSIETVVQTLKLNFVSLSTLQRRPTEAEQRLLLVDVGGAELKAMSHSLSTTKQELADVQHKLACCQSECSTHRAALGEATAALAALEQRSESALSEQRAACQRVAELQAELLAERKLRELLEQSHATALEQIRDLEAAGGPSLSGAAQRHKDADLVDEEMRQLKSRLAGLQEELSTWKDSQKQSAQLQTAVYKAMGERDAEIRQLQHEKQFAIDQMADVHAKYQQLNEQLDQMHSMFEELQQGKLQRDEELEAAASARLELERELARLQLQLAASESLQQQSIEGSRVALADATEQLRASQAAVERLEADRSTQAQLIESLKALIVDQQTDNKLIRDKLEEDVAELHRLNAIVAGERDVLLQSRQSLLDEVNAAAELMSGEKESVDAELREQQALVSALQQQAAESEALRTGLEARISVLQQQLTAHGQFEQTIGELLEQKSKLAYENGQLLALKERLQSVEQENKKLQQQLQAGGEAEAKLEVARLKEQRSGAEAELKQLRADAEHGRAEVERLTQECRRLGEALATAMTTQLAKAKGQHEADEVQKDAALLSERVEELEEVLKTQASVHEQTIDALKQDSVQTTNSLEGLVELHTHLQTEFEKVQRLLGKRDGQLQNMRLGSKEVQRKVTALEKELECARKALIDKEAAEASKVKSLQQRLRRCKQDNCTLVKALKECYASSRQAEARTRELDAELARRAEALTRLQADRLREREELATYHRDREERTREEMESLAAREREKVYEKVEQDMQQLQRETESLLERISDLQRANDMLEMRLRRSESAVAESCAQHAAAIAQLDSSEVKRRHLEHAAEQFKGMAAKLAEMEHLKDQYMRKSAEQEQQIDDFASQVRSLQAELKEVVSSLESKHDKELSRARRQAADERRRSESLSRRCGEHERRTQQLELALTLAGAHRSGGSTGGAGGGGGGNDSGREPRIERVDSRGSGGGSRSSSAGQLSASPTAHHRARVGGGDASADSWLNVDEEWPATSRSSPITSQASRRASASTEESQMVITAAKAKHFVQASQAALSRLAEAAHLSSPPGTASDESNSDPERSSSSSCHHVKHSGQRLQRQRHRPRAESHHPRTPSESASESSSRQLEALIEEMERRHLISH